MPGAAVLLQVAPDPPGTCPNETLAAASRPARTAPSLHLVRQTVALHALPERGRERRIRVQVTDELAERLADDTAAGYPPARSTRARAGGAARVWRRVRAHRPPSTPGSMRSSSTCSSSVPIAKVSTSSHSAGRVSPAYLG
jgi:hypothetical protein